MKFRRKLSVPVLLCLVIATLIVGVAGLSQAAESAEARKARLEAELEKVNKEIVAQKTLLNTKRKESASIERDIEILDFQINTAKLNIKAKQLEIEKLTSNIGKKNEHIGLLVGKLTTGQESLVELLRQMREVDDDLLVELAFEDKSLADLYRDFDYFFTVERALVDNVTEVRGVKKQTENEKIRLEGEREEVTDARNAIEAEKRAIEADEAEKQRLLSVSKKEEANYREVLIAKQQRKQAILDALFGLRDSKDISFGQAYEYAKVASNGTGVRVAFLLAILTQESNLGKNVGTCNREGDPESKRWYNIMKPERDIPPFKQIVKELGLNIDTVPLSCPMGGGWGGAMGPAQFIPSTWAMYKSQISKVTGNKPPNPWDPEDAFTASALLLSDLGASGGKYTAERRAALKYYAGGNWDNPKNAFYGDNVMKIAEGYQAQIDLLQED